jgi:hypothetical protein
MRMKATAIVAVGALALSACGSTTGMQPQAEKGVWLRADGQSGKNDPAMAAQFESDSVACRVAGQINQACMSQRGYLLVPESQVEAKAAELRAAGAKAKTGAGT